MSAIIKNKMIEFIKTKNILKTKDLQNEFNLTISTLRRYLIQLENEGLIERLFGEIIYKNEQNKIIDEIANENILLDVNAKKSIAKTASKFVHKNTPIFLDSGSTCFYLLDYLNRDNLIYTNSIFNASEAIKKGFKNVHILGGKIKDRTQAIVNLDYDFLSKMYFSISFLGVNGIDEKERLTTPEESEGATKKLICEHSDLIIVLCEQKKFYKKALYDFTPTNKKIVVVTNAVSMPEFAKNYTYVLKKEGN